MMRRTDLARLVALAAVTALSACAGAGPPPRAPATPPESVSTVPVQDLLAHLEILIAAGDADASRPGTVLAEARALRAEALAALAAGDESLATDLLTAAIALFGDGPG
jgi:predicted small lipoprotein YifL